MVKAGQGPTQQQIRQTASAFIGQNVDVDKAKRQSPVSGKLKSINEDGLVIEGKNGKSTVVKYRDFERILLSNSNTDVNALSMPETPARKTSTTRQSRQPKRRANKP